VFREIGEQDGQAETNFSSRLVETLGECGVINLSVVIGLAARKKEADFISKKIQKNLKLESKCKKNTTYSV
jgi:hypothetical protein